MMLRSRVGMARHVLTVVLLLLLLIIPAATYAGTGPLVVAVATGGDVYWWHQTKWDGEMIQVYEGNALKPFIAPDGNRVAFTAGDDGLPQSLWVVADNDEARQMLTPAQIGGALVDQVEWLDATTVYFNTSTLSEFGAVPQDDLWRVDTVTEALTNVLPAGEGGAFDIARNGEYISVVSAGTFDEAGEPAMDGEIRLIGPSGEAIETLLTFPPIQTFSHAHFYPEAIISGGAVYTAIPEALFDPQDNEVEITLWRFLIGTDESEQSTITNNNGLLVGYLESTNGIYYIENDPNNGSTLYVAENDGTAPIAVTESERGNFTSSECLGLFAIWNSRSMRVYSDPTAIPDVILNAENLDNEIIVDVQLPCGEILYIISDSTEFHLTRRVVASGNAEPIGEIPIDGEQSGFAMDSLMVFQN